MLPPSKMMSSVNPEVMAEAMKKAANPDNPEALVRALQQVLAEKALSTKTPGADGPDEDLSAEKEAKKDSTIQEQLDLQKAMMESMMRTFTDEIKSLRQGDRKDDALKYESPPKLTDKKGFLKVPDFNGAPEKICGLYVPPV